MSDLFTEHMVKKHPTRKTTLFKVVIVVAGIVVCAALFLLALRSSTGRLIASVPAILIILYVVYRLALSRNVEYEYSVTNGEFDIDKITAGRSRKHLIAVDCRSVEQMGCYNRAEHIGKSYRTRIYAVDSLKSGDLCYCTLRHPKKGYTLIVFNANEETLRCMKPFLPDEAEAEILSAGASNPDN